jgi:hypothetical protein
MIFLINDLLPYIRNRFSCYPFVPQNIKNYQLVVCFLWGHPAQPIKKPGITRFIYFFTVPISNEATTQKISASSHQHISTLIRLLRPHHREKQHILYRYLVGEQHAYPVDTEADTAGRWHTVFQRS